MNASRFGKSSFRLVSVETLQTQQTSLSSRLDISNGHEEASRVLLPDTALGVASSPLQVAAEVAEDDLMGYLLPPRAELVHQEDVHVNLNDETGPASNGQWLDISCCRKETRPVEMKTEETGGSFIRDCVQMSDEDLINMILPPRRPRPQAEFFHQDYNQANGLGTDLGEVEDSSVVHDEAGPSSNGQVYFAAFVEVPDGLDSLAADSNYAEDADEKAQAKRGKRRAGIRPNADRFEDNFRGLGDPRKTTNVVSDEPVVDTDDIDVRILYKSKMKVPLGSCPPPPQPPSKAKGGRKSLQKMTIESAILDAESAVKGDLHTEEAVTKPTYGDVRQLTYTGPFSRCILQHEMQTRKLANDAAELEKICKLKPEVGSHDDNQSQPTVYDLVFSHREPLSFKHQLKVEQFCSVLLAYFNATEALRQPTDPIDEGPRIDPVLIQAPSIHQVLTDLAARIHTDSQFRHLNHWNLEAVQQPRSVLVDLNENYKALATTVSVAHLSAVKAVKCLRTFTQELLAVKRAKESIHKDLETLKCDLTKRIDADPDPADPIIEERRILNAPYLKTPAGITYSAFTDLVVVPYVLRVDKQKWTVKDLAGLKAAVKQSLTERAIEFLDARYVELLATTRVRAEKEIALAVENNAHVDEPDQPVRRRRGRPSKTDVEKRDRYGSITPILCRLPNGSVVSYRVTPKQIGDWRTQKEKRWINMSYENVVKELSKQFPIDWEDVCDKHMRKNKKLRSAEDCKLAFNHEIDPCVNPKRLTKEELDRLQEIASNRRFRYNWTQITKEMNRLAILNKQPVRTSFFLFTQYKMKICPGPRLEWTPAMDDHLRRLVSDFPGDWRRIAFEMNDERITKMEIQDRFKKHINPILRMGPFTRVEDALLLLTIERLKPFLLAEGHFASLLSYLPWRYETAWRDRANNLFSDWIVPWTMEEDVKLLEKAVEFKRNWQKISEQFNSFKNRKGCLTRYKILTRHLKDKRFKSCSTWKSIELYHEAYAMTRYNVFQYRHLREVLELLVRMKDFNAVEENKKFLEQHPFGGLERDKEPEEDQLRHMLITFDSKILRSTIKSLRLYVRSRDSYWQKWKRQHGSRKRTFDRRTFHKNCPQSVASALHIRGLKLQEKEAVKGPPLNEFEEHVYVYFGRFQRTKPVKIDADRPYLPSPADLITWPKIARIVATSLKEVAGFTGPCNKKWQRKGMPKRRSQPRGVDGEVKGYGRKLKRARLQDLVPSSEDEQVSVHSDFEEDKIETMHADSQCALADVDGSPDLKVEIDIHPTKDEVQPEEKQIQRRNPTRAAREKNKM